MEPGTWNLELKEYLIMGRGDKRTRRGKIFAGSYGKTRPQYKKKNAANVKPAEKKSEE